MLSIRNITICGIYVFLCIFIANPIPIKAADTTEQIVKQIDEILKENPIKSDEKFQMIKIIEDNTIRLSVLTLIEGFVVKRHFHKTHNETYYVVKGTAQLFVNDKWVDIKPGTLHFNPMGKVHSIRNTGNEPVVVISVFTPAMKEPDRHFIE